MNPEINLGLHEKQGLALLSSSRELAYGGAAGGGKSHLGRVAAIYYCANIPGLQTYLFRREHNELVKNHMEGVTSLPALLNPWVRIGKVRIVKDEIRFWNGSKIFLCHCQHEKDVFKWLGPEMYFLIIEQAEQFTEFMLRMLFGRNRLPEGLNIPEQYKHLFPRTMYTFNPGGPGHAYFVRNFYREWKKKTTAENQYPIWRCEENGRPRQFIQALLQDNPSVNPTEYAATLGALPPRMKKALLEGDMEQVMGAYFPDLQRDTHLIKPFRIPDYWPRFMGMDWGACGEGDPYSIGYWAVSDGSLPGMPRGFLLCYRVIRGHGLPKTTVTAVAERIKGAEKNEQIIQRVAGGDIENDTGFGTSIFEEFGKHGIHFRRADMRRLHGWTQMQERAVGKDGTPMIGWFEDGGSCEAAFEAICNLQHDVMGDINDTAPGDDHDADQTRYACMDRPYAQTKPPAEKSLAEQFIAPTVDELWAERERMMSGRR